MGKILVVDDEQSMREFLGICLRRAGHEVRFATGGREAVDQLRLESVDVVVTDLRMPGELDGLGLLHAIKSGELRGEPVGRASSPADGRGSSPAGSAAEGRRGEPDGRGSSPAGSAAEGRRGELDGRGSSPAGSAAEGRRGEIDSPEVILVTAFATADTALAAMKQGAYDYLIKPFQVDEITAVIARALEKRALVADNAALRDQLAGRARLANLLGKSRPMQKVFELIGKIHSTRTSVLITGESGTGKELVARALHTEGSRAKAAFIAVNCGAIPADLLESELFGHKKGAFTGAVADKIGMFVAADGGTMFLDEIGELPSGLQVKLLRALQERRIKPVGATDEIEIDARVIAATNRDLEAEVARGAFRADLFYRLNVIEIHLPALRQRREDLPLLAEHFLRRFGTEHGRTVKLTTAAARKLESFDFPGNVRELENMLERAIALSSGPLVDADDLPDTKVRSTPEAALAFPPEGVDLERLVADHERAWVTRALELSGGVRKRAAALLGISFRSLRYRLVKLGIEKEELADEE